MKRDEEDDPLCWEDGEADPLTWGGEADATHADAAGTRTAADRRRRPASPGRSRGRGTSEAAAVAAVDAAAAPAASSLVLVTLGILAGVYLLYTLGWVSSTQLGGAVPVAPVDAVMAVFRNYVAIAAPAVWFAATLVLTRGRKTLVRLLWLLLGVIALLPIPLIVGT